MEGMIVLYLYLVYLLLGVLVELVLSRDTNFVTNYLRWDADLPWYTERIPVHCWPIYVWAYLKYRGHL